MLWFALFVAALLVPAGPALAAIRIISSTYENGFTTVSGQTKPAEKVTLDGNSPQQPMVVGSSSFMFVTSPILACRT